MKGLALGVVSAVIMGSALGASVTGTSSPAAARGSAARGSTVSNGAFMSAGRHRHLGADPVDPVISSINWSGYVQESIRGHLFSEVTDTFVVPTVDVTNPTAGTQYAADWVGIGGLEEGAPSSITNLVQAGTQAAMTTTDGQTTVSYDAWTEILPRAEQRLKMVVSAGDTVTVTVREVGKNRWRMTVDDVTTGVGRARTATFHSYGLTAEAIHERPCLNVELACEIGNLAPLAPTSDVTFEPGSVSESRPGAAPVTEPLLSAVPNSTLVRVVMLGDDDETVIATPSAPDTADDGFTVADGDAIPLPPA